MIVGTPTKLNLIPSGVMPVVYINQGDAGYDKEFLIYNGDTPYNVPSGVSATIRGTKADNYGVTEAAEVTTGSNLVTVTITEQMVAAAGANLYELVFVDTDGLRIATINMVWAVKADALGDAVISDSDLDYATTVMNQLQSVQAFKIQLDANTNGLATEKAARVAADNAEATARVAADNTLQSNVNSERSARITTDNSLQSQINQLVAPTGSAPSAAEVQNARIGANGTTYDTLGNSIRTQVNDLRTDVNAEVLRKNICPGWKQGYYSGANGNYDANHNNYICTISPIDFTFGDTIYWNMPDYSNIALCFINCYDSNMSYIGSYQMTRIREWFAFATTQTTFSNVAYANFSIGVPSGTITPSTITGIHIYKSLPGSSEYLLNTIKNTAPYELKWSNSVFFIDGAVFGASANRIGLNTVIEAENDLTISIAPGYKYAVFYFSSKSISTETYIKVIGWTTNDLKVNKGEYFLINLAAENDADITPTESVINTLKITPNYLYTNDLSEEKNVAFSKGTLNADGTTAPNGNGVYTEIIVEPESFYIAQNSHAVMLLYRGETYLGKINSSGQLDQVGGSWYWFNGNNDITSYLEAFNANAIRLCVVPTDSTTITTETAQSWGENHCTVTVSKFVTLDYVESVYAKAKPSGENNYAVGSDLLKKYVGINELGLLTYLQAFCRYNGKYYSIDGSNIAEQDSYFNVLRNVPLNTGHGNALQLGGNGIAYASGWNDNKIYSVNLNSLTIDSVITLPTTGYTTGAVDEAKGLAYIFQRDSYPDHEDNYNFIVYDINNETIVSTKQILAFGAMQACDLFNDRIIVINGLGNSTCPNGYRVFDTNGNILADYYLGNFSTVEPEGVCIDRDNHELLISLVNKKLYKLSV